MSNLDSEKEHNIAHRSDPRDLLQRRAFYSLGKLWEDLLPFERFNAVGYAVRDLLVLNAIKTERKYKAANAKRAYYLSLEFLIGRSLRNNLVNLKMLEEARAILRDMDNDLDKIMENEQDAALGNGGLGRLAACFIDSLATLEMPGFGYGILYEYGLFKQVIQNGHQVEKPDYWMLHGTPWLIKRTDEYAIVQLGGHVKHEFKNGSYQPRWVDYDIIVGEPYDLPIVGYGGKSVNYLRLFSAKSSEDFNMQIFNEGDYIKAVEEKVMSETISKVLYPNDQPEMGQRLRLIQEYFLVTCSIQDMLRRVKDEEIEYLPDHAAIHLNDTHPALAVPELMRHLIDNYRIPWETAWELTNRTISYTNHTLLPEALEKWPVQLMYELLPRHMEIIFEINDRFLKKVRKTYPNDKSKVNSLSIIEEGKIKQVRMANLSIIGSHSVNGVAAVHSELVKTKLVPDFFNLWPEKFNNKTNGVTPRRWILSANPSLSNLINEAIGDQWITDLEKLRALENFVDDPSFIERFGQVKMDNKERLAKRLRMTSPMHIDPTTIFDVQIKRIHQYKRQLLNVLNIMSQYVSIMDHNIFPEHPRTYIFAGKAAPGYHRAKEIIYLIHMVADAIHREPRVKEHFNVIFVPNYSVSVAEYLIPAAEVSEQISTAGYEASGTGNMKFAMNGALTIGTLDGANIEICEEVGDENIFIFGNTVEEIKALNDNSIHPNTFYHKSEKIRQIMNVFNSNILSPDEPGRFHWVYKALVNDWDPYFHLADLEAYVAKQAEVDHLYGNQTEWNKKAILNTARMAKFSSDRTIKEYADEIWGIKSIPH